MKNRLKNRMRRRNWALVLAFSLVFALLFPQNANATVFERNYCDGALALNGDDWLNINESFTSSPPAVEPCYSITGSNVAINLNATTITSNDGFGNFVLLSPGLTNISIINNPIGYGVILVLENGIITNSTGSLILSGDATVDLAIHNITLLNLTGGVFGTPPVGLINFNFSRNKVRISTATYALGLDRPDGLNISYNVFYNATTKISDVYITSGRGNIYIHDNNFTRTETGGADVLLIDGTNASQVYSNNFTNGHSGTVNQVELNWTNNTVFNRNTLMNVTLVANASQSVTNNTFYLNSFTTYKNVTALEIFGLRANFTGNEITGYHNTVSSTALLFLNDSTLYLNIVTGNVTNALQIGSSTAVSTNITSDALSVSSEYEAEPATLFHIVNLLNSSFNNNGVSPVQSQLFWPTGPFTELKLNGTNSTNFTDMAFLFSGNYSINSTASFNNTFLSPSFGAVYNRTYTDAYSNLTLAWYVFLKTQYPNGTEVDGVDVNITNGLDQLLLSCTTNATGYCATKYNVSQTVEYQDGWSPNYNNHTMQGSKTGVGYASTFYNLTLDSTLNLSFGAVPQFWWQAFNITNGTTYYTPLTVRFFVNLSDDNGISEVNLTFASTNYTMTLWNGSSTNGVWNYNITNMGSGTHYYNYTGISSSNGTYVNTSQLYSIYLPPSGAVCGNGICEAGETSLTCAQDCGGGGGCVGASCPTPTPSPTATPTATPTPSPTATPSASPTVQPTSQPTSQPSAPSVETETPLEMNTTPVCKPGAESTLETIRTIKVFERNVKEGNKIVRKFFTLVNLKVTNTGLSAVANVLIEEKLPAGNAVFQQQPYLIVNRRVSWLIDTLAPSESKEFSYIVDRIVGTAEFSEATAAPAKITAAAPDYLLFYMIIIGEALVAIALFLKGRKKNKEKNA